MRRGPAARKGPHGRQDAGASGPGVLVVCDTQIQVSCALAVVRWQSCKSCMPVTASRSVRGLP